MSIFNIFVSNAFVSSETTFNDYVIYTFNVYTNKLIMEWNHKSSYYYLNSAALTLYKYVLNVIGLPCHFQVIAGKGKQMLSIERSTSLLFANNIKSSLKTR